MQKLFASLLLLLLAPVLWGYTYITDTTTNLPLKWPAGTMSFTIMLDNSTTLSDGTTRATIAQAAIQTWNAVLGDLVIKSTITTGSPTDRNHVNEIAFATNAYGSAFDKNTLAITTTLYISKSNQRTEADILFNNDSTIVTWTWDSYRGPLKSGQVYDIQRVLIHEMGHALGLNHPDQATPAQTVSAVMNSMINNVDAPTADDIAGVQNLYGPPGTPANDNFAQAIALSNSAQKVTATGFNTNATIEAGEPQNASNAGGQSVWWKWTPTNDGTVTIDTRGSYLDTTLGIYTGSALSSLTQVATNDDITQGIVQASSVTFSTAANTTYYISVDGFKDTQIQNGFVYMNGQADSGGITLNVNYTPTGGTAPSITTQPASQTVLAGTNVSMSVKVTGSTPLTYQWYFTGNAISGATSDTLTLTNVQSANAGSYTVTITNVFGSVTSNGATLTVNQSPSITTQPASLSATAGTSASFSVVASGTSPLTYQWAFGGANISGATSSTLSLSNVQAANAGSYTVMVTNAYGSTTSNTAVLTVNQPAPPPSGGGGGGGAPSAWFLGILATLLGLRFRPRPRR